MGHWLQAGSGVSRWPVPGPHCGVSLAEAPALSLGFSHRAQESLAHSGFTREALCLPQFFS